MASNLVFALCALFIHIIPSDAQITYTKCYLNDTACLTTQAANAASDFAKGMPSMGVITLEPILASIQQNAKNLQYTFNNMTITGLGDATIDKLSVDTTLNIIRLTFHTSLNIETPSFTTQGYLFSVPFDTQGSGNVFVDTIYFDLLFPFEIVSNSAGQDVFSLLTFDYGFQILGDVSYDLDFQGQDEATASTLNNYMNNIWRIVSRFFGIHFYDLVCSRIYNATQAFLISSPLEDIAIYTDST